MLQKSRRKELKTAASLYKKQQLAEAKVEQQRLKEVKKQERDAAAAQHNAAKTQKQQERNAVNTQKALQLSQRGKRPASQKNASKSKCGHGAEQVQEGAEAAPALPAPPKQYKQEQSRGQIDILNSTSLLHCPNYYKTKKSRDNSCYEWCCSLIFVCDHLEWGGSLAALAQRFFGDLVNEAIQNFCSIQIYMVS
jgi:hypothetical protein